MNIFFTQTRIHHNHFGSILRCKNAQRTVQTTGILYSLHRRFTLFAHRLCNAMIRRHNQERLLLLQCRTMLPCYASQF